VDDPSPEKDEASPERDEPPSEKDEAPSKRDEGSPQKDGAPSQVDDPSPQKDEASPRKDEPPSERDEVPSQTDEGFPKRDEPLPQKDGDFPQKDGRLSALAVPLVRIVGHLNEALILLGPPALPPPPRDPAVYYLEGLEVHLLPLAIRPRVEDRVVTNRLALFGEQRRMNPASGPLQGDLFLARRFIAGRRKRPFQTTSNEAVETSQSVHLNARRPSKAGRLLGGHTAPAAASSRRAPASAPEPCSPLCPHCPSGDVPPLKPCQCCAETDWDVSTVLFIGILIRYSCSP
jgi:hypothetical protein